VNVVVIDDTPVMLLRLERLVQTLSECQVIPFSCALDALAWCVGNEPDLLIVDYLLPDMSGLDFVERLRESPRNTDVPVVMVTQDHDRAVRRLALQVGVNDFLTKPFDQAELQARVRNMLVLRGRHKALAAHAARSPTTSSARPATFGCASTRPSSASRVRRSIATPKHTSTFCASHIIPR
jgi:DNA-binding response OmpR family regulator